MHRYRHAERPGSARRRRNAWLLFGLPHLAACFPAVMHGPRVQEGLSGTLQLSHAVGPTHTWGDMGGMRARNPLVGAGLGRGWRSATPDRTSVFFGMHVPAVFPLAQLDLYVQAPEARTGRASGGLGINASLDHVAPYALWGIVDTIGRGWSTTQGVSVLLGGGAGETMVAWTPGVTAHLAREGSTIFHLFAMGAFGRARDCTFRGHDAGVVCGPAATWAITGGVALELRRRRRTESAND